MANIKTIKILHTEFNAEYLKSIKTKKEFAEIFTHLDANAYWPLIRKGK
jgi:hypothetical protein